MLITELKNREEKRIKFLDKKDVCFACEIFI
jgi:hypothetical protein